MPETEKQDPKTAQTANLKKKAKIALILIGVFLLLIWIIPLAPKKDVIITTQDLPRLDGAEGTTTAYCVYYVWDGKQEEQPWWVIFQAPLKTGGSEWAVLEVADIGDVRDPDRVLKAMRHASKFDKDWFRQEMHRVQRTRLEKVQHIFFGGDALRKEEHAIEQVLDSIGLNENT